jgi:outer membrane protein assembly factor BamB
VDTITGRELWRSPKLGDTVIAATSGILTDYGGAQDVILVGSRTPTGDSKFYGLKLHTGAVDWIFDNGGGPTGIGLISGQAQVSYATNRVYFASRAKAGGSPNTLWCLELVGSPTEVQLAWARDLGDIDGSPILRNGVLYVGNNAGQIYAIDPVDGSDEWLSPYTPPTDDGAVKGFVWVDTTATPTRLFYSTTSQVHGLADGLTSATELWPAASFGSPSPLIVIGDGIWFGSTDDNGSLRRIDKTTGLETDAVLLGDSLVSKSVGSPTYDIQPSLITVGTDEGRVYAVEVSSP